MARCLRLPGLFALFVHVSALPRERLCLPEAIPPAQRKNLLTSTQVYKHLNIYSLEWISGDIVNNILHIIVTERLGVNATLSNPGKTSIDCFYAAANCKGPSNQDDRGCPEKMPQDTDLVVCLEAWNFEQYEALLKQTVQGFRIDELGSIGYIGLQKLAGGEREQNLAYSRRSKFLEYYKTYNLTDVKPWEFFPGIVDIDPNQLRPCSETRLDDTTTAQNHLKYTGDYIGIEIRANRMVFRCWDEHWWYAPTCRLAKENCIPVITGGNGWYVHAMAAWAATYQMPLALAVAKTYDDYTSIAKQGTLFYAYEPDPDFQDLNPFTILFPSHDPMAWADGDSRTGPATQNLRKLASLGVETASPTVHQLASNMELTSVQIHAMLKTWKDGQEGDARLETDARKVACDWLKENEDVWKEWIPDATACVPAMGLINDEGTPVFNRSEATSCQWCPAGTFSERLEDLVGVTYVCTPCPAGQGQPLPGQLVCVDCEVGRHAPSEGTMRCEECQPGRLTAKVGQEECQLCAPGRVQAKTGASECEACLPGTAQPGAGNVSCILCSAGFFQPRPGEPLCDSCDTVILYSDSIRGATSADECLCPVDRFMRPVEGRTPVCEECSMHEGLQCPGGNDEPLQARGYWVKTIDAFRRVYSIFLCRDGQQCPLGTLGNCADGRTGTSCNSCMEGYYPLADGRCQECVSQNALPLLLIASAVTVVVIVVLLRGRVDASTERLVTLTVFVVFGQLTTMLQAFGTLNQLPVRLVEPARTLIQLMGMLTFDFVPLRGACVFQRDDPVVMFVVKLLLLPMLVGVLCLTWLLGRVVGKPTAPHVLHNTIGAIATTFFISITLATLLPVQCRLNPNGSLSMSTEPGIVCFGSEIHWVLVAMTIVGVFSYPVFILAAASYSTLRYPSLASTSKGYQVLRGQRFFYARFKPDKYYFGVIFLIRGTLVPLIPVAFVGVPEVQCCSMVFVLLVVMCVEMMFWPWRTQTANWTAIFMGVCLIMSVVSMGPIMETSPQHAEHSMSWFFCVFSIGVIVVAICILAYNLYKRLRPTRRFGAFLCHHKATAGALARQLKMLMHLGCTSAVFLDSDELDDLDGLFDIVRSDIRSLVVMLNGGVLTRVWCAGEITTAIRNKIHVLPVYFDAFKFPDKAEIVNIMNSWSVIEWATLLTYDILQQQVMDAYETLGDLPWIHIDRKSGRRAKDTAISKIIAQCHLPKKRFLGQEESDTHAEAEILVMGNVSNVETLATCEILQMMLQERLQLPTKVAKEAANVHCLDECTTPTLVVVLTQGLLEDVDFAESLLEAVHNLPYSSALVMVPVAADKQFQYPTLQYYEQLKEKGLIGQAVNKGPQLAEAYKSIFSNIALPLSPQASEAVLKLEVSELCRRRFGSEIAQTSSSTKKMDSAANKLFSLRTTSSAKKSASSQSSSSNRKVGSIPSNLSSQKVATSSSNPEEDNWCMELEEDTTVQRLPKMLQGSQRSRT